MPVRYEFHTKKRDDIIVISLSGYFEKTAGAQLRGLVQSHLNDGFRLFAFDCMKLNTINSLGITTLLDLAVFLVEECQGRLVLFGLSPDKTRVMNLAGMSLGASIAITEEDACGILREESSRPGPKSF